MLTDCCHDPNKRNINGRQHKSYLNLQREMHVTNETKQSKYFLFFITTYFCHGASDWVFFCLLKNKQKLTPRCHEKRQRHRINCCMLNHVFLSFYHLFSDIFIPSLNVRARFASHIFAENTNNATRFQPEINECSREKGLKTRRINNKL